MPDDAEAPDIKDTFFLSFVRMNYQAIGRSGADSPRAFHSTANRGFGDLRVAALA